MKKNERGAPQIKICGLTEPAEAAYLNQIYASYAGFVFWEKSKRNINFARAREIRGLLNPEIKQVAVTVSPSLELVKQLEAEGFDILQVHGEFREKAFTQCRIPAWRACNVGKPEDIRKLRQHEKISGYVIDAGKAGSGRTFDWEKSREAVKKMRDTVGQGKTFVLAGGLNPQNAAEAVRIFEPDVVDVSSGVEGSYGKKDGLLIQMFAEAVRGMVEGFVRK